MSATADPGRRIEVPCTVDLERTLDSFHAYVELEGVEVGPGDRVIVHDAPTAVAEGERLVVQRSATVIRATWLDRLKATVEGYLELTELYEVGFERRAS
jgi:hypothetical protein